VATENFCIYDAGDDAIIVEGSFIEMEDLLDTMAGNLIITTPELVEQYRQNKGLS
jgi:hypothetical protein